MHILKRKSLSFVMAICLIFSLVTNGNMTALAAEAPEQPSGTGGGTPKRYLALGFRRQWCAGSF